MVRTEQNDRGKLDSAVFQAVLNFKLKKLSDMRGSLDKELEQAGKDGDDLKVMELITRKKNLDRLKTALSAMVRRVVA